MLKKNQILIYQDQGAALNCVAETIASFKNALPNSYLKKEISAACGGDKGDGLSKGEIYRFSPLVASCEFTSHEAKLLQDKKLGRLRPNFLFKTITAQQIQQTNWENSAAIFVMPGGRSLPFYQALGEVGNQKIIEYVKKSGNYLGFCAGAYYGSARTEFEKGQALEVICQGQLNFFPGIARGSVYGLNQFHYENYRGARIAQIEWHDNNQIFPVYYNGGGEFVAAEKYSNVQVLARYADIKDKPAAIVECQFGDGRAILSGVHPEFSFRGVNETQLFAPSIIAALLSIEEQRLGLANNLLTRAVNF